MSGLLTVGYFLFSLMTNLLIFVLWTRIALRYFKVSSLHPVSQMIIKLTAPILTPCNKLFSLLNVNIIRYDWPCFLLIILVELIKFFVIGLLFLKVMLAWPLICAFTAAELVVEPCNLLFYALIIRVIMSWVSPGWQHPIAYLALLVTEPLLASLRRRLPTMSGFDFSPLVAIIILKVITLFITASLPLQLI